MPTTTVRISTTTRDALRELAASSGENLAALLDQAVDALRRDRFFAGLDAAYTALENDPVEAARSAAETELWSATLADGLNQ